MTFYVSDDWSENKTLAKENPCAQYVGKWCDAHTVDRINGDSRKCPVCGGHVSNLQWLEPRKMRLTNTRYPDRLSFSLHPYTVVSEGFKTAYEDEGLQGILSFTPIEVVKVSRMTKAQPQPPQYYLAETAYNLSVRFDHKQSIIIGNKYDWSCELCNPLGTTCSKRVKIVLDTSKWDGTDIFEVYSQGLVYSQRFYDFVQKHGFTNFNLVPIEEYQW